MLWFGVGVGLVVTVIGTFYCWITKSSLYHRCLVPMNSVHLSRKSNIGRKIIVISWLPWLVLCLTMMIKKEDG